jgi:serine/threonine protein phosphatase PrpC
MVDISICGRTDKGVVRDHNEDALWFDTELGTALVADGVGGMAAGDVASAMTVAAFERVIRARLGAVTSLDQVKELLSNAVGLANQEVQERISQDPSKKHMGSTAVCACHWHGVVVIAHIGDSRAYLLRGNEIVQLTKDHSYVQTLVDEGAISQADALRHPQRNLITRCIGADDEAETDLRALEMEDGDLFLLCSDGLSGVVLDEEIRLTITRAEDAQDAVEKLIQLALAEGAPDNVTAVLLQCGEKWSWDDTDPVLGDTGSYPTVSIDLTKAPTTTSRVPAPKPQRHPLVTQLDRMLDESRRVGRQVIFHVVRYTRIGLGYGKEGLDRLGLALQKAIRRLQDLIHSIKKR